MDTQYINIINRTISTVTPTAQDVFVLRDWAYATSPIGPNITFSSCTSIGKNAFAYCQNLSEIHLNNCYKIGDNAFNSCTALTSVYINTSNCTLGTNVFTGANNLNKIYVPNAYVNTYKTAANWSAFSSKIYGM